MEVKKIFQVCLWIWFLAACAEPQGFQQPEDGLDAAREFIRATLDGDYEKAEMYVLRKEEDLELFNRWREHMSRQSEKERLGLKSSNIIIESVETLNDSMMTIQYSNSFHKQPMKLSVARQEGEWRVKFSEMFK